MPTWKEGGAGTTTAVALPQSRECTHVLMSALEKLSINGTKPRLKHIIHWGGGDGRLQIDIVLTEKIIFAGIAL